MVIYTEIQYTMISIYNNDLRQLKHYHLTTLRLRCANIGDGYIHRNPVYYDFNIQHRSETTRNITLRLDSDDGVQ